MPMQASGKGEGPSSAASSLMPSEVRSRSLVAGVPIVLIPDPVTGEYTFTRRGDGDDAGGRSIAAAHRRGRFVIKLAAALFLATQTSYDTPGKCTEAMKYLWGHNYLAQEYVRRHQKRQITQRNGAEADSSPEQLLAIAEGKWKEELGVEVLQPGGFRRCYDDLVPFFLRSLEQQRKDKAGTPSPVAMVVTTPDNEVSDPAPSRDTPAAAPLLESKSAASGIGCVRQRPVAAIDLSRVPARGISFLAEGTVRYLQQASSARRAQHEGCTDEELTLAESGWLPVRQVLEGVYAALHSESALRQLWLGLRAVEQQGADLLFLSLLNLCNITGRIQWLHDALQTPTAATAMAAMEEGNLYSVTHLRATWGHTTPAVAAAVLHEYPRVPLTSLVEEGTSPWRELLHSASPVSAVEEASSSMWYEYMEDIKPLRKDMGDFGVRVFSSSERFQVLLPRAVVRKMTAVLRPFTLLDTSSRAQVLMGLMRQSKEPSRVPGSEGSGAFGSVDTGSTSVTETELLAMVLPGRGFATATTVAVMTFHASRLTFLPVTDSYLTRQASNVCGWRAALHHHRRRAVEGTSAERGGAVGSNGDDTTGTVWREKTQRLTEPYHDSQHVVLVDPRSLTYGVVTLEALSGQLEDGNVAALMKRLHTSTAGTTPQGNEPDEADTTAAAVTTMVKVGALYDIGLWGKHGGLELRVCRPPTELLVDLRLTSLWDLWMWYGFYGSSGVGSSRGKKCSQTTNRQQSYHTRPLMEETTIGVSVRALRTPSLPPVVGAVASMADEDGYTFPESNTNSNINNTHDAYSAVAHAQLRPWELFPLAEAEALLVRLDAVYTAALRASLSRWAQEGLHLLRPTAPRHGCTGGGNSVAECTGARSGSPGVDLLMALRETPSDAAAASWTFFTDSPTTPVVPSWQQRENALWEGLSRWVAATQTAATMPALSLLLPSDVTVRAAKPSTDSSSSFSAEGESYRLGHKNRRRGISSLRRLVNGTDATTVFFIESELTFSARGDAAAHRAWVLEPSGLQQRPITARQEVALLERQTADGEWSAGMYLCQPCVLHRTNPYPSLQMPPEVEGHALQQDGGRMVQQRTLRLWQFIGSGAPAYDGERVANSTATKHVDPKLRKAVLNIVDGSGAPEMVVNGGGSDDDVLSRTGALTEVPVHHPVRHGHAGCLVTPLWCDELVLGAAWPADCIVDALLLPPLQEALVVYVAKLRACRPERADGTREAAPGWLAVSTSVLTRICADLRQELLAVLTSEAAMELNEFYGDAVIDYCTAVTTVFYRHACTRSALWRGGSITAGSTNRTLAVGALPLVLRDFWMARRRICNDKRLADCVESLFGAVTMAVWVLPLQRQMQGDASRVAGATSAEGLPDADMLLYVAAALLQLLKGSRKEQRDA